MTEFIIVGRGLAAVTLSHVFYEKGISFKIIGRTDLSNSSRIAAGIWNPIVFKRLTKSWIADDLVPCLNEFYKACEGRLHTKLITQRALLKPFGEEQEKAFWLKRANGELKGFLEEKIHEEIPEELKHCKIPMGYANVLQSGNLDMESFLDVSSFFFKEQVVDEVFDHNALRITENGIEYKSLKASNIIFCEGFLVKDNPYFNWLPLKPAKGEVLTISVPKLQFKNTIFNKNGFLMDLPNGSFKAGATYAWDDLTQAPTTEAANELRDKIQQMITCDYEIQKHEAGIRPSSLDRRPMIGTHPKHNSLYVFNGLGTKGVMLAPYFANKFVNFYLQKAELPAEVNIRRFYHLYEKKEQN